MSTVVRRAGSDDAAAISALRNRAWRAAYRGIVRSALLDETTAADHTADLRASILERDRGGGRTWIAERDGAPAGFVAAGPARDEDTPATGEIYGIYADPDAVGTGVGRAMMRTACGWLAARGFTRAVVWVFESNDRARRFYEKGGWTDDDRARASRRWDAAEVRYRLALPTVRPAGVEDARGIAVVHVRGWQIAYRGIISDAHLDTITVEQRTQGWRSIMRGRPAPAVFVVETDGVIAGFASGGETRDTDVDPSAVGEVSAIYVDPAHWGGVVADAIFVAMIEELRHRDYAAATLWVLRENARARRFYERHGWRADGAAKVEDRGTYRLDEIRYRLDAL